jgi:alpha-L-arabinofuranosidase
MPAKTFKNHGLRADLAQVIADIHPKFVRFPGGCLAHGVGLPNIYRWKNTIGPIEQRRQQPNLWGYHQSVGLGYFEYFQFCEDIGAKPLPVIAAAVTCQHSGHTANTGQQALPLDEMPAYIQDILDLVEWANGPATSTWGAKRAAAGHSESFHLQYLGIGNEDAQTPEFRERFKMIYDAVHAKCPDITIVGTVGPFPDGEDFDLGWEFAGQLKIQVVDEHYYQPAAWFLSNLTRYDAYDRSRSHVYLGEYASKGNAFSNALAEAAYMTSLERNADVVQMASYAPLLARIGHTQWNPDLIYFNGTSVFPTCNYYVQRLFGNNAGDAYVPTQSTVTPESSAATLAVSSVRDSPSGDIILKLVNVTDDPISAEITLAGAKSLSPAVSVTLLTGARTAKNDVNTPAAVTPQTSMLAVSGNALPYTAPARSLTILRFAAGK